MYPEFASAAADIPAPDRSAEIARLNDEVRHGRDPLAKVLFMRGVAELLGGGETDDLKRFGQTIVNQARLMQQIAAAPIEPGDDPYGERDFGAFTFMDRRLFWKIDSHAADGTFAWGSDAPWDPLVTIRVLTIMLPEEY